MCFNNSVKFVQTEERQFNIMIFNNALEFVINIRQKRNDKPRSCFIVDVSVFSICLRVLRFKKDLNRKLIVSKIKLIVVIVQKNLNNKIKIIPMLFWMRYHSKKALSTMLIRTLLF